MFSDYETRAEYLTLALDSRRVIDSLLSFVQAGEKDRNFAPALTRAIESLQSDGSPDTLLRGIQGQPARLTYEQIATMNEVEEFSRRKELGDKLERILGGSAEPEEERKAAREAINFFFDLESHALHRYNQPSTPQWALAAAI